MELSIDTSTEIASIALSHQGKVRAELTWHCGHNHTVELVPSLLRLLEQSKVVLKELDGVIVAKGPGSFNGLRVGMSTAKGLAYALEIPLVSIGTLEVEALQYASSGLPICPVFNAGRGEIATALFQSQQGEWRQIVKEHITTVDELCSEITGRTIFCGRITPEVASGLRQHLGEHAVIPDTAALLRRAGFLAELGWRRLKVGDYDDVATLQPLYLRKPKITTRKR